MSEAELLKAVQLYVDPATAEKIMKKGIAEIVLRRKDKKFNSFVKAKIADSHTNSETAKQIMNAVLNSKSNDSKIAATIRNALDSVDLASKRLSTIDKGLRSVSTRIESVFNLASKVQALSFINIGLSATNIAVDITGFIVISKQLKGLSEQINQIAPELSKIKDISIEDMRSDCEKLYLEYNSFTTKIHDGDKIDRDDLEKYLQRAKPFISKLIRLLLKRSVDAEILLNMIFTLLPAYTSVLCIFIRSYYFEKHSTPFNYDIFRDLYQEINDSQFRSAVQDYYLLEQGYNYRDVIDILNVQLFSVFSERLEIDDQLDLLEVFGTEEAYFEFERALDAAVEKEITQRTEEIADRCGEYSSECKRVLQTSV